MTLTQILQKIKSVFYTKSEIDSMGGGSSLDATIKSKANDDSVVKLSGDQTIDGLKNFNEGVRAVGSQWKSTTNTTEDIKAFSEHRFYCQRFSSGKLSDISNGAWDVCSLGAIAILSRVNTDYDIRFKHTANTNSTDIYRFATVDKDYNYQQGDFHPKTNDTYSLGSSTNKWKTINGLEPSQLSLPNGSSCISITPSYTIGDYITMTASGFLRIQAENTDYELVMNNGDGTIVCSIKKLGCRLMIVPVVKGQQFRVTQCEGAYGVYLRLLPSQGNI